MRENKNNSFNNIAHVDLRAISSRYGRSSRTVFRLVLIAMAAALVFVVWQGAAYTQTAPRSGMPTMRGQAAVEHLKQSGQYESLVDAVTTATTRDRGEAPNDAFSLQKRVVASEPEGFSFFGESVAISGSTAIVGALNQTVNGHAFQGAAYIFVRSGNTWVEQEMLTAADGEARDAFGYSVAIDGERAIVGAADDTVDGSHDQGSAYVFIRSGSVWNQEAKLTGDMNGGDEFGSSVAISGLTAVVGSQGDLSRAGAAYVFVKGNIWTRQQKLTASDGVEGDAFGFQHAVAIHGETIVIGARFAKVGSNLSQGAAYIFTRSGSTWTEQQKLTAPDGMPFAEFGLSVAVNRDTAVVGAWRDQIDGSIKGSAYVFVRDGVFWALEQKLTPSDARDRDRFGRSVAVDGETIVVGNERDVFSNSPGSAYIFVRSGNTWTEQQRLASGNVDFGDRFGSSVAIDGGKVIIGAVMDTVTRYNQGSAYIYGSGGGAISPPDSIAFSTGRDGNDEIYTMNPDGSNQTRLTNDTGSDLHPSFTGDESQIVFSTTRDGNSEIYSMNMDGSAPIRLTEDPAEDRQPSFSRDGLSIVFTSDHDGNDEIYRMRADGTHITRLTNNAAADTDASFSPPGTRIIFERVTNGSNRDLFIMNADGSGQTALTNGTGDNYAASFSRDGTRIAFASTRSGNSEIYSMNSNGSDLVRLTNNSAFDTEPSFSPDGTHIVFESDRDGDREIYVMNADGTNPTRISNNPAMDSAPDWGGVLASSTTGRVVASDGLTGDFFGQSVAISGDTAIIGALNVDVGSNFAVGAAYIFVRSGGAWIEQQRLMASDGADGDQFGWSVAIDGETVIIGAAGDNLGTGTDRGSAYVFTRNGAAWTQQQKLTAPDAANNDFYGWSVAIDGGTAVVGAENKKVGTTSNGQGAAYVYVRDGATWVLQQQLLAPDGALLEHFGSGVAIDGQTIVVGAKDRSEGGVRQGAAYVFVRTGSTWDHQQKLLAADGADGDNFGISVGLSGETAIIGSGFDDIGTNVDQGSAYIFVRSGGVWTEQQKLTAADGLPNDYFGWGLAIDGETVVIGASNCSVTAAKQGAAYTFVRSGTTWTQLQKALAPDAGANDNFGLGVAVQDETALVGAPHHKVGANANQGAVYVYQTVVPPPPTPTPSPTVPPTPEPNTPAGSNVRVQLPDISVTFSTVTTAGQTTLNPIDPRDAGAPPAGYDICQNCPAYNVTTTAVYVPPIEVCLGVPTDIDQQTFLTLALLHGEGGILVDRTTGRFTDGDGNRSVCGSVESLSPFVLAQPSGQTPTPTATSTPTSTPTATPTASPTPAGPTLFDMDGDGQADVSVFRPADRNWYVNGSISGFAARQWGLPDDRLAPEDYDGDGKTDIANWRADPKQPDLAFFYIINSSDGSLRKEQFGSLGDTPLPVGDWDGDGKADLAVYRNGGKGPSYFFYRPSSQPGVDFVPIQWGQGGDIPLRGDFDGDGKMDAAVFRQGDNTWYIQQSSDGQTRYENWGLVSDKFVPADYDGDGKTDLAVFRQGTWYIKQSSDGEVVYVNFGLNTDVLVPGDYDGDGKTDVGVFRNGDWYILLSGSGAVRVIHFGEGGDTPAPSAYVQFFA